MEKKNIYTCLAPVNIAVIKYWGKKDEKLIIPLNDSVSLTLNVDLMHAKTTVMTSPNFRENKLWLNGREESFDNPRISNCLKEIKSRALELSEEDARDLTRQDWKLHICSENNFPTAAGLASSAAGYACLVYTLAQLYSLDGDLSVLARRGSGSACRSVFGGFVRWFTGVLADGSDSIARQIAPASHWKELRVLILVVENKQKQTSSTTGMQDSVATSELLKHRVKYSVPPRVDDIIQAIHDRNFAKFAEITMRDSNQFHAVALDTYPPAVYMNDISHYISRLVHNYNRACGATDVAYTFDAGANACLFMLEDTVPLFLSLVHHYLPQKVGYTNGVEYFRGKHVPTTKIPDDLLKSIDMTTREPGLLKYIIHTNVGDGPVVVQGDDDHLLDEQGVPKNVL